MANVIYTQVNSKIAVISILFYKSLDGGFCWIREAFGVRKASFALFWIIRKLPSTLFSKEGNLRLPAGFCDAGN